MFKSSSFLNFYLRYSFGSFESFRQDKMITNICISGQSGSPGRMGMPGRPGRQGEPGKAGRPVNLIIT